MGEDLTGKQFGILTVEKKVAPNQYLCRCACGNEIQCGASDLLRGHNKSCGCLKHRHKNTEDLTGMRSGKLVVIEQSEERRRNCQLWLCRCDCGKEILLEPYKIKKSLVRSCGCTRGEKRKKDLSGQRFGKLTALRRLDKKRGSSYLWLCRCDCGREIETTANALLSGNSKSCGCGRVEAIQNTMKKYGDVSQHAGFVEGTCLSRIRQTKLQKNNTSGHTGVQARGGRWIAVITFKQKVYYLGIYSDINDAIRVRKQAEELLFGEFLNWYYANFPREKNRKNKLEDSDKQSKSRGANEHQEEGLTSINKY